MKKLIVGDTGRFAVESHVNQFFDEYSQIALGYFNIHIAGVRYGVKNPKATLLACSYQTVRDRISARGRHVAPFARMIDARELATIYLDTLYWGSNTVDSNLVLKNMKIINQIEERNIAWAPDGDAAFDDSSHVLQFDSDDHCRLIGFKNILKNSIPSISELQDVVIPAILYYEVISNWADRFIENWLLWKTRSIG
jgi:hypothetical protein